VLKAIHFQTEIQRHAAKHDRVLKDYTFIETHTPQHCQTISKPLFQYLMEIPMSEASKNNTNPPATPVHDETSLLPPIHPHSKEKSPGSHSAEIAVEVEDGQVSPGELSSENDI
jgi:hypothetical protein